MLAVFNNKPEGPTIKIGISAPQSAPVISNIPPGSTDWLLAIADTGASCTCICAKVAQRAGLPIIGKGNVQSATHVSPVNIYFGDLWIGGTVAGSVPFFWTFRNRRFYELALPGNGYEALLGMDVFQEGILIVDGPSKLTTFAW